MKTQNELQKMNDQQLTYELACLVFGKDECYMSRCLQVAECTSGAARYVDLNDWSWVMPLAVERGLSLVRLDSGAYTATNNPESYITDSGYRFKENGGISCFDSTSPQRAIAICLVLKLQEVAE